MEENLEIGERTRLRQQQGSNPGNRIIQFDIVKTLDAYVKTLDTHRQRLSEEKSFMFFFSEIKEILTPFVFGNSQKLKPGLILSTEYGGLHFESRKRLKPIY